MIGGVLAISSARPAVAFSVEDGQKANQLNESAIRKMKSGNLDGALIDLLQALEYANQDPKLKKNLGVVYYEKGARALNTEKNFFEAERYFKEALAVEPANERYRKGYAAAVFLEAGARAKQGQNEAALSLYQQAAQYDTTNIHALIQAGHYAWVNQKLDLAKEFLTKAKAIDPDNKNVRILESKLGQASSPEEGLETQSSEHFILSADPGYMTQQGSHKILYELEQAYGEVSYKLSYYPKNKIPVVFYPLKEFHGHWKLSNRVSGYYDGKLRIPYAGDNAPMDILKPILRHELTHAFVSSMNHKPIPRWVNEGLAQWVEGRQLDAKSKEAIVIYHAAKRLPKLSELDGALSGQKNNTETTLAYMKAFSVIEYLIDSHGVWSVWQLIRSYETQPDIEGLFKKYFQSNVNDIDERWIVWLEKHK